MGIINFGTLLPYLLFYFIKGSSAQTDHDVVTYTTKLVEKLECSFTSTIVLWTEQQDDGNPINLFLYEVTRELAQKQTNDSKYDNFEYLIEGTNQFNLVINNVDKGDGGRYQCNPITSSVVTFDVTVEVLPESINIDCTELNVCMPSSEREAVPQITCVCMATGLSTLVLEIEWEGVDMSTASNITRVESPTSGSFIISSNTTFPPPSGTSSLSCSLTGYRSQIPEKLRSFTYTFTPPECNLVHDCPSDGTSASVICRCSKGSPKVNAYIFYNSQMSHIGTQRTSSKNVQVDTNKMEMFYCSGCNGVHNQTVGHEFSCKQGSVWWIFIVILLLLGVVVAAVIFVVVKKCRKKNRLPKPRVLVAPVPKPEGDGAKTHLLYENTPIQDHKKVQGPGGMNSEPLKGGPALKKNDKQKKVEPGLSRGEDDNKDSEEKDHRYEEISELEELERCLPDGQEIPVHGQSEIDVGSVVDSGTRQSEIDVGSVVDSGTRQSEKDVGSQVDSGERKHQIKCMARV